MLNFLQKPLLFLLLLAGGSVAGSSVLAETCTYGEAIMALEQGNTIRGMALMRMANRDGDERASRYLVVKGRQFEMATVAGYRLLQPLLSLNQD